MKRILILLAVISICSCKKYNCHCVDGSGNTVGEKKIKAKTKNEANTSCAFYNIDLASSSSGSVICTLE